MGEEVKKEEETKQEEVKEEGKEEEGKKEEPKGEEEKKEEAKGEEEKKEEPKAEEPPPPVVLQVDLHCVGCAKKIQRSILRCKGVEGVEVEMGKNLVRVKGIVDPQALCKRIQKKTMRKATIVSPVLPPPPPEGEVALPLVVHSQVSEATTVELKVNMHCEACAQQLQKKIQRMKGVQTVETNLAAAKVMVTGTVTGEKLVEYIHRRTGKLAAVIPPPLPPPKEEEKKEESDKPAEDKPPEEKKEEKDGEKKEEEKPLEEGKENAEGEAKDGDAKEEKEAGDAKKEGVIVAANNAIWHPGYMNHGFFNGGYMNNGFMNPGGYNDDEMTRRMMMMNLMPMPTVGMPMHHMPMTMPMTMPMQMQMQMPMYMIDRQPPPQIFSDENPNACCIT